MCAYCPILPGFYSKTICAPPEMLVLLPEIKCLNCYKLLMPGVTIQTTT